MSSDKEFGATLVDQYGQLASRADEIKREYADLHGRQVALSNELSKVENLLLGIWDLLDEIGDAGELLGVDPPVDDQPDERASADEVILKHLARSATPRTVWKVSTMIIAKKAFGVGDYTDSGIRSAIARACGRGDLERVGRGKVRLSEHAAEEYAQTPTPSTPVSDDGIPF